MIDSVLYFVFGSLCSVSLSWAVPTEYEQILERDHTLRSIGRLQITNAKGDVSVQGWSQDRIRIKFIKKVIAGSEVEARPLFDRIQYRYEIQEGNIEISNQYGEKLSIEEALNERGSSQVRADMQIFAPANLKLSLWVVGGKIRLKGWNSNVEVRSKDGWIYIENTKAEKLNANCLSCSIFLKEVRSDVRAQTGSGSLQMDTITGKALYFETDSGSIKGRLIRGNQFYLLKSGTLSGHKLDGKIGFHTGEGAVTISHSSGFLSGSTESGSIRVQMTGWKFLERALIESVQGNIALVMPRGFSAELDLESALGKVQVGFPLIRRATPEGQTSSLGERILGQLGNGRESFRVFTEKGSIRMDLENEKKKFF